MISKPAPHWEGTAVHNGAMKELKLTDFKGKYLVCDWSLVFLKDIDLVVCLSLLNTVS
jgi:hypothetical protein